MAGVSKAHINFIVDKELRDLAQQLANEAGLPLSTVITIQLKDFVRSRTLVISLLPHLQPSIEQAVIEKVKDYEKGINLSPILNNPRETTSYLRKSCL